MHKARDDRRKVLIRATMRAGGPRHDVCIRDISPRGMMMQAQAAPPRGTYVEILVADRPVVGRVVWAKDRRFGIRTSDAIDILAIAGRMPAESAPEGSRRKRAAPSPTVVRRAAAPSRAFGSALEFALIGAFALALVIALVGAAFQILSNPLDNVSRHLTGGPRE